MAIVARIKSLSVVLACAAGMASWTTAALAQSTPAAEAAQASPAAQSDTRRLPEEQRQAILESNTVESAAAARGELSRSDLADHRIHGEVGFAVGTGGSTAVYGTADIPLGDRAAATVSIESSRYAYRR